MRLSGAIWFAACITLSATASSGQDSDEEKARALIPALAGLPENFNRDQFLNRPALSELLVLDRAAVAPLEQALRGSQDWTMRATAAYLLAAIGDTSCFPEAWRLEPNPMVKVFLFEGTKAYVGDYTTLLKDLENSPELAKPRRDELTALSESVLPLSDAQTKTRLDRLLVELRRDSRASSTGGLDAEGRRALGILAESGVAAISQLTDAFYAVTSLDTKENVLVALRAGIGGIRCEDPEAVEAVKPHLMKLLNILETASGSPDELRYKTLDFALTLALLLDAADENPEPALNTLRRFESAEARDDIREHARYLMARWTAERKAKRSTSDGKTTEDTKSDSEGIPRTTNGSSTVRKDPTSAPSRDAQAPRKHSAWVPWMIGLTLAAIALIVMLRRIQARRSPRY